MEGFKIGKKGTVLDSVQLDISNISLLSRGDGTEIMLQFLEKEKLFYMYPADNPEVMEFCYILSGKIVGEVDGQKIEFGPHEYFSVSGIKEPVHFEVLIDTTFIWVSTEPVFIHLSKEMSALMDIVKQVELKDRYTYNHGDRVVNYSIKIAKKMRLSKVQLENLNIAASLHDIGKVHISEEILNKSTALTTEEFNIIKKHPLDGAEMLKGTVYEEACPILAQHHERLNGTGYPYGLKGEEILLEARIIAVSDTFDAMAEDRSYRKAFNAQFAFNEIKKMTDTHYDRKVVEAFEDVLREEGMIQ